MTSYYVVLIKDANGNPVPGVMVTGTITGGGIAEQFGGTVTDSQGQQWSFFQAPPGTNVTISGKATISGYAVSWTSQWVVPASGNNVEDIETLAPVPSGCSALNPCPTGYTCVGGICQPTTPPAPAKDNTMLYVGIGIVAVAVIGIGAYALSGKRKMTTPMHGSRYSMARPSENPRYFNWGPTSTLGTDGDLHVTYVPRRKVWRR